MGKWPSLSKHSSQGSSAPSPEGSSFNSSQLIVPISAMMFLQFLAVGLWQVTVSTYIGANTGEAGSGIFDPSFVGTSGISIALGALFAPLFFGALADSWFRTEHLMAALNVGCAVALWLIESSTSQGSFFLWLVVYYQFCIPALTLCNSLALRHFGKSRLSFSVARSVGTLGWIVAMYLVGSLAPWLLGVTSKAVESSSQPMLYASVAHLAMALFALTLPHTPPLAGAVTWRTLFRGCSTMLRKQPRLMRFFVVSFFASIAPQFYNMYANLCLNNLGVPSAAITLSYGQVTEILFVLLMPWLLVRWGPKHLFAIGLLAWAVRYACLAMGGTSGFPLLSIYVAILLHGACYGFVYMTAFIYVDASAPEETRGAAQGMFAVVTAGFGQLAGSLFSGTMQSQFLTPAGVVPSPYNWNYFFLVAAGASLVALFLFWLLMGFHREVMPNSSNESKTNTVT